MHGLDEVGDDNHSVQAVLVKSGAAFPLLYLGATYLLYVLN